MISLMYYNCQSVLTNTITTNLRGKLYLLLLWLMFIPFTILIKGSFVSINYLLIFLFCIASIKTFEKWDPVLCVYVLFCCLSYLLGMFVFSNFDSDFLLRQLISFIIFLLPLFILFVRVPCSIDDICRVVFVASILYSAYELWIVVTHGVLSIEDSFDVRAYLADFIPEYPQGYIIVILFSVFYGFRRIAHNFYYFPAVLLLLFSVYISFTRAAWLGLAMGFIAYFFAAIQQGRHDVKPRWIYYKFVWLSLIGISLFSLVLIIMTNSIISENIFLHANRTSDALIGFMFEPQGFNPEGSEGVRLQIWSAIIDIIARNPVTGTGFAGTNLFLGENWGTAHSQYMDILLRTGLIGLGFYFFLWIKNMRYYFNNPGIFAGLVSLFILGLFQETTKLSYGALLFFLLLSHVYSGASIKTPNKD